LQSLPTLAEEIVSLATSAAAAVAVSETPNTSDWPCPMEFAEQFGSPVSSVSNHTLLPVMSVIFQPAGGVAPAAGYGHTRLIFEILSVELLVSAAWLIVKLRFVGSAITTALLAGTVMVY